MFDAFFTQARPHFGGSITSPVNASAALDRMFGVLIMEAAFSCRSSRCQTKATWCGSTRLSSLLHRVHITKLAFQPVFEPALG